jgi:hypothetical protein
MEDVMKLERVLIALTLANLLLLVFSITQVRRAEARDVADVLRGHALEIVDGAGRVRASIQVHPANPDVAMPDGTKGYPETAILRLITEHGAPSVKLSASERGGILVLGGESNPIYAQINGGEPSLTLKRKDGRQHVITP